MINKYSYKRQITLLASVVLVSACALIYFFSGKTDMPKAIAKGDSPQVKPQNEASVVSPSKALPSGIATIKSVLTKKSKTPINAGSVLKGEKVDLETTASPYQHFDFDEEGEEGESEKADWSIEREEYETMLLVDPATGRIPREAGLRAGEAAKKAKDFKIPSSLNTRSPSIGVTQRGPNNLGGRTRAIGIDVRNASIMIAGSVSSGVYRSTDGGGSWTRVAPIGQIHNITSIAQDPRPGFQDTWYYGTGESSGNSASNPLGLHYNGFGIWKSTDNGLSWAPLASTQSVLESYNNAFDFVPRLVVDPTNGNVYAAASNTIVRSTDGGVTWTTLIGALANNGFTDIIATPSGRLYAAFTGTDANNGVWTSTTGNLGTWTRIAGTGSLTNHPNWNAQGAYGRVVLAYAPSSPNIVFALYWNNVTHTAANQVPEAELFRWNQTTSTWTDLSANLPDESGYSPGNDPLAVQTGYDLVVAVKPDDVNTVFVGGTNIYRSTSGFTNTTATTRIGGYNSPANYALYPNHHPDNHVLIFAPGDNNTAYSGNDGGIQKADITTPTVTWTSLNNNYITYQYYYVDISPQVGSSAVLGGAQDNGTTASTGSAFNSVFGGDGCAPAIMSYSNATSFNIIATSQSGNIVRLIAPNFGVGIRPTGSVSLFVTYLNLDADNTNYLYLASGSGIFRTRNAENIATTAVGNAATGWDVLPTGIPALIGASQNNVFSIATSRNLAYDGAAYTAPNPNRKLYIGTTLAKIYRVNDPAFTTAPAVDITPAGAVGVVTSISVNPLNDSEVMFTISNYGQPSVFHTLNANCPTPTWTIVEGPATGPVALGSARSSIITKIGNTTTYLVGNTTGLYCTQALNGAATVWDKVGTNEINYAVCRSMRLRAADNTIALGTHGNGIFELNMPLATIPPPTVATVSGGRSSAPGETLICGGDVATLRITGNQGPITGWQKQENCTGAWVDIAGSAATTFTVTPSATACYRAVIAKDACEVTFSNPVTVTVDLPAVGGQVVLSTNSAITRAAICPNTSITLAPYLQTGKVVKWQFNLLNSPAWIDVPGSAGALTITINGSNVNSTVFYRVIMCSTLGYCSGPRSVGYSEAFKISLRNNCSVAPAPILNGNKTNTNVAVSIYPNPAFDKVTLNTEGTADGIAHIEIIDIAGKKVLSQKQELFGGSNQVDLDVRSLTRGVYSIRLIDADNEITILRMVKQ
jgi:Secretion system C-terminal sorting domain